MPKHTSLALCFRDTRKSLRDLEILLVCEESKTNLYKQSWRWSLPGGKCCADKTKPADCCSETPEQTVIRECKEETGFDVAVRKLFLQEDRQNPETRTCYKRYIYVVTVAGGESLKKKVFGDETPRWVPLSKLPRNIFQSHRKIIEGFVLTLLAKR